MTDVERLLAEATPLPWRLDRWLHPEKGYGAFHAHHRPFDGHGMKHGDLDLAEYAVNRLPDYEALREAVEYYFDPVRFLEGTESAAETQMLEALARLREKVPS